MRIGELARRAGTSTKAVRFYESAGLLPTPPRASNGYRAYTAADADRLRLLVGLRSLDLPLDRAGELAVLCAAGHCERVSDELRDLITGQRAEIRHRIDALAHLDKRLTTLERHLAAGDPPQSVIPRGRSLEMTTTATCDCPCGQCCGCSACGCGCDCSSHSAPVARDQHASPRS
jgi:DNA-binding transcriptional MerR regulator